MCAMGQGSGIFSGIVVSARLLVDVVQNRAWVDIGVMLWFLDSIWGKTNPRQIQNKILQTWHTHRKTHGLLGLGTGDIQAGIKIRSPRHVGLLFPTFERLLAVLWGTCAGGGKGAMGRCSADFL
jgi:hypothetical protein